MNARSSFPFSKYQAAGNDFILIDGRLFLHSIDFSSLFRKLCDRKFGIGADGGIVVTLDPEADFAMRIFNADGGEAEGCGNGLCIVLQFLRELAFPDRLYQIRMGERIVKGFCEKERSVVELGVAKDVQLFFAEEELHFIHTGAPHLVQFVSDIDRFPLEELGTKFVSHPKLLRGANVNIAEKVGENALRVRTFERGVEGETLSCGTGAAAVAAIAAALNEVRMPVDLHFRGGMLQVWQKDGSLFLASRGQKLFSGWVESGFA